MSPKLTRVDCRQLIRALKRAGFEEQRQRGSHLHLRRAANVDVSCKKKWRNIQLSP
jgi:predicted RNA binding protein YcfA (HicA-like mRNA interferase family)